MHDSFDPHERPPVKCRCADADVKPVKCKEILRKVSVDVMNKVGVRVRFMVRLRAGIRDKFSVRLVLVLWTASTSAFYAFDIRICPSVLYLWISI